MPPLLRGSLITVLLLTAPSCHDEVDWCTEAIEAADEGYSPLSGSIAITYFGDLAPQRTIAVVGFARPDAAGPSVAYFQGCSRQGGDLWRFRGGFSSLVETTTDVPVTVAQSDGSGVRFVGELYFCPNGNCEGSRMTTLSHVSATGTGTLHAFSASDRHLEAEIDAAYGASSDYVASLNVSWTPAPAP